MHTPRLKLVIQFLPASPIPIIRIINNHLPTLPRKEIPHLILNPILDPPSQRNRLLTLGISIKVILRHDICSARENLATVVSEREDTGFDAQPTEVPFERARDVCFSTGGETDEGDED